MKISAVINTYNEEANIVRCLRSVVPYVDEVIIVDMHSTDATRKLARKYTKKIYQHEYVGYVEPARNFALGKATGDWILLLDADEELPESLGIKLRRLAEHADFSYYRIPRKNLVFGKWIAHSGWWPDFQIRFFKKGTVSWNDEIHSIPITLGKGSDMMVDEKNAIVHHHYKSIDQFLTRLNRYTSLEVKQLKSREEHFYWRMLITKPAQEFITRYFAWQGYKDGIHGLALSLLQAFSFFIVYLKLWETEKFSEASISLAETQSEMQRIYRESYYWYNTEKAKESKGFAKFVYRIRALLRI